MDEQRWRERAGSFGGGAQAYARSRPTYPVDAVRWVLPDGARRVLDLGAGTGRLTEVLLGLGLDVVAVEPAEQMRALIPGRAEVLAGTAEQIPLPDACVDAVLVGQAFHWFDVEPALVEIARVLRPGGTVGLLWNFRDESVEWVRRVWDLLGTEGLEYPTPFAAQAGLSAPEQSVFTLEQLLDADLLVDLLASRSVVLTMAPDERGRLLQRARELAPENEPFVLPYRTQAWRSVRT